MDAFCAGEKAAVEAAHTWLYANGGFDPQACVDWIGDSNSIPARSDSPSACAAKVVALSAVNSPTLPVGYASDRTGGKGYNDDNAAQAIAAFMLARKEMWFFGVSQHNNSFTPAVAALMLRDDGAPLGDMTRSGNTFSRRYERATVSLDCDTFTAAWTA